MLRALYRNEGKMPLNPPDFADRYFAGLYGKASYEFGLDIERNPDVPTEEWWRRLNDLTGHVQPVSRETDYQPSQSASLDHQS